MKYLIIILISFISNVYGQTKANGTFVGFEPDGSTTKIGDTAYRYIAHTWNKEMLILKSTKKYPNGTWTPVYQFDSTKYYWRKKVYWSDRMNREAERINKNGNAKWLTKDIIRFQDSAYKYQDLAIKYQIKLNMEKEGQTH